MLQLRLRTVNKVCGNKMPTRCNRGLLHLVGILFPHINDDARSKSHQISKQSTFKNLTPRAIFEAEA